jgi:hypothetical protein
MSVLGLLWYNQIEYRTGRLQKTELREIIGADRISQPIETLTPDQRERQGWVAPSTIWGGIRILLFFAEFVLWNRPSHSILCMNWNSHERVRGQLFSWFDLRYLLIEGFKPLKRKLLSLPLKRCGFIVGDLGVSRQPYSSSWIIVPG